MPKRTSKKRSRKAGLPPGTPVHIGDQKIEQAQVTILDYDRTHLLEQSVTDVQDILSNAQKSTTTWVNIDGLHDIPLLQQLGSDFDIHPLILEDIPNTDQRPKIDNFDLRIFVVLNMLEYHDTRQEITSEQVSFILGPRFLLSFQEKGGDVFDLVRQRIRTNHGRIRSAGPDYLMYTLIDVIVDHYFVILEKLGERIEAIEAAILVTPSQDTLRAIHQLKRELIVLRKSIWPLREVVSRLEREESDLIHPATRMFFRDIYDHTIQIMDTVETYRDMTTGMMDIYLSSLSNNMNAIMKVLTIIATIFIPLTFIVGVYGMNFEYMPELHWKWGYPLTWLLMILVASGMLYYFRRKNWI